jgi:hypothetical protein
MVLLNGYIYPRPQLWVEPGTMYFQKTLQGFEWELRQWLRSILLDLIIQPDSDAYFIAGIIL